MLRHITQQVVRSSVPRSRHFCRSSLFMGKKLPLRTQKRQFFVRAAHVPDHLEKQVYKGWHNVFGVLFATNAVVWTAWQTDFWKNFLPKEYDEVVAELEPFMENNFVLSTDNWDAGRYWTLITHSVSHKNILHFGLNMVTLYTFGSFMFSGVGPIGFSFLYLGSAASSALAFLYGTPEEASYKGGLGASGVAAGIAATSAVLTPLEEILVLGIPIPVRRAVFLILGFEALLFGLGPNRVVDLPVSHIAHLGGAAFGFTATSLAQFLVSRAPKPML